MRLATHPERAMRDLSRRVATLETRSRWRSLTPIPIIAVEEGETGNDAIARYVAAQGLLPPASPDRVSIIVLEPAAQVAKDGMLDAAPHCQPHHGGANG